MELEQVSPNKPNFPLIVALFSAAIVIIFAAVLFGLHVRDRHIHAPHATQLQVPTLTQTA